MSGGGVQGGQRVGTATASGWGAGGGGASGGGAAGGGALTAAQGAVDGSYAAAAAEVGSSGGDGAALSQLITHAEGNRAAGPKVSTPKTRNTPRICAPVFIAALPRCRGAAPPQCAAHSLTPTPTLTLTLSPTLTPTLTPPRLPLLSRRQVMVSTTTADSLSRILDWAKYHRLIGVDVSSLTHLQMPFTSLPSTFHRRTLSFRANKHKH